MLVTRKQHFMDAGFFWGIVGFVMIYFGTQWVWLGFSPGLAAGLLLGAAVIGLAKGEFAIGKAAKKAIFRIQSLPEKSPFWRVFGKKQWILILAMMSLGMIIRFSGVSKAYRGVVLTIIGLALIWGSRYFWRAFRQTARV